MDQFQFKSQLFVVIAEKYNGRIDENSDAFTNILTKFFISES